jgi:hypothetical protein
MRVMTLLLLSLMLAAGPSLADDPKPAAKKSKPAAKSDKNVFQKTESSVGDWAHRNKIWTRSEPRGTAQKKAAAKPAKNP